MKRLPLQKPQTMVSPSSSEKSAPKCPIANSLEQNMRWLQERYIRCSDLVYRQFTISGLQELQGEPVQPAGKQYRSRKGKHPGHQNAGHGFTL